MGFSAKVTSKGQITIPSDIRAEFGIERGDDLVFYKGLDGRMSVRVRRRLKGSGAGSLHWPDAPKDRAGIADAIGEAMEAKHGSLSGPKSR